METQVKRIALGVQYDGSSWNGWQTQPNRHTVQDKLQEALHRFTQAPTLTTCAGRTDAGVHGLEQVVHFDTPLSRDLFSWVRGTNAFLPPSIAVRWARDVTVPLSGESSDEFHARFSARGRTYHYVLYNHPVRSPLFVGRAGWVFRPLDTDKMRAAAQYLIGTHDFSAFRSSECQAKSPVKLMHDIRVVRNGDLLIFTLKASAFLHHMVRNIIGSLVFVGTGSREPLWMKEILEGKDRAQAAPTFMPDGLYLAKVDYDAAWGLPEEEQTLPFIG
jgi:tRNA pseudouridine38-40 synthase